LRGSSMLKISDAASLALHTMVFLAAHTEHLVSNKEIAVKLGVSEAHLSKVLQRLAKVGLVHSTRGPKGGFSLGKNSQEITLLEVYETIEGPIITCQCLLDQQICAKTHCILGPILHTINAQVKEYFGKTNLYQLIGAYACC